MRQRTSNIAGWKALAGVCMLLLAALQAQGQVTDYSLFWSDIFSQTSGTTVSPSGAFFSARAFLSSSTYYDGGALAYPGPGSPQSLSPDPAAGYLIYQTGLYATQAEMDADFPAGTYTIQATDSTNTNAPQTISQSYTGEAFSQTTPTLTSPTYNALQGMNPATDFDAAFNSFLTNPADNNNFVFVNIYDSGGNAVFSDSFLTSSTTSVDIPANTLNPDAAYTFELIFSSRSDVSSDPTLEQGFDYRTEASFDTGNVPEPASLGLAGAALFVLGRRRIRG
jgi:hypothetical protein